MKKSNDSENISYNYSVSGTATLLNNGHLRTANFVLCAEVSTIEE